MSKYNVNARESFSSDGFVVGFENYSDAKKFARKFVSEAFRNEAKATVSDAFGPRDQWINKSGRAVRCLSTNRNVIR